MAGMYPCLADFAYLQFTHAVFDETLPQRIRENHQQNKLSNKIASQFGSFSATSTKNLCEAHEFHTTIDYEESPNFLHKFAL